MIDSIVFDLGNVLVEYQPYTYLVEKYGEGKQVDALFSTIFGTETWLKLDEGTITNEEACEIFTNQIPQYAEEVREVLWDWHTHVTEKTETAALLRDMKMQGYRCYYLSNFQEHVYEYIKDLFSFWQYFDGGVFSFQEKLIKPDRRIYEVLLDRYDLEPGRCIFLDDVPKNIEGAKEVGMHGIVFEEIGQVKRELEEYLKRT